MIFFSVVRIPLFDENYRSISKKKSMLRFEGTWLAESGFLTYTVMIPIIVDLSASTIGK